MAAQQNWPSHARSKDGNWLDSASQELYENVCEKIGEREDATEESLSADEQNGIFQDVAGNGSGYLPGRGYMAKSSNSDEVLLEQLKEQKETNEKLTVLVEELQEGKKELEASIVEERTTRERQMKLMKENIRQRVHEELLAAFRERM